MSATLMIIDVQNGYADPENGRRGQPDMITNIAKLLGVWRERGDPVVYVKHNSLDPNSPYRPGQPGNDFVAEIAPLNHEAVVEKQSSSAFIGTDLLQVLEEIGSTELVVAGLDLEKCVESTVRMAADMGFMVFIAADCVGSIDRIDHMDKKWTAEEVHAMTLAVLKGSFASVLNSQDLISEANH